jgi:hypothetical protein
MKKLNQTHVEIEIPATVSIVNFIERIHPAPIVAKLSDVVGITILSIITYRNKNQDKELDESKFNGRIKLYIPKDEVARRGCKLLRRMAIVAIQEYITRLLYSELEKQVAIKTIRHMGKKRFTIMEAIEQFQQEYGLCEEEFNYLRLQQHLVRKKRKA